MRALWIVAIATLVVGLLITVGSLVTFEQTWTQQSSGLLLMLALYVGAPVTLVGFILLVVVAVLRQVREAKLTRSKSIP